MVSRNIDWHALSIVAGIIAAALHKCSLKLSMHPSVSFC